MQNRIKKTGHWPGERTAATLDLTNCVRKQNNARLMEQRWSQRFWSLPE
jgi:hypothetical protein